jgi:hypothetical protein
MTTADAACWTRIGVTGRDAATRNDFDARWPTWPPASLVGDAVQDVFVECFKSNGRNTAKCSPTPRGDGPMTQNSKEPDPTALVELLAVYLATAPGLHCPGCDRLLTSEVVAGYPAAAMTGAVPGETELCTRHPELTAHIVAFFFLMAVSPQYPTASGQIADEK